MQTTRTELSQIFWNGNNKNKERERDKTLWTCEYRNIWTVNSDGKKLYWFIIFGYATFTYWFMIKYSSKNAKNFFLQLLNEDVGNFYFGNNEFFFNSTTFSSVWWIVLINDYWLQLKPWCRDPALFEFQLTFFLYKFPSCQIELWL